MNQDNQEKLSIWKTWLIKKLLNNDSSKEEILNLIANQDNEDEFNNPDDNNIKKINKEYRKKNKTTDVLTFVNSIKNNKNINETYCDIFFSAETIKKDAKKNIINFYDHITHLMIHCFLHVNGYDHKKETDFIKMKNLEEKILMKFDVESPYLI